MALTKTVLIADGAVTSNTISETVALGVKIANVSIANSSYTVLDDTAVNTAGGYIVVTGAGFKSGAIITIGDTNATTTTFVNSTTLRAQVPAKDAATYTVYVTNTDGSVGLRINGLTYSNTPVWGTGSTLDNQEVDIAFAVNISANSDSSVTYANTTALPAGTDLLSNGYFYGTITGIEEETTYTFTVDAIDAENQENSREFSVTVTVAPSYQLWTWGFNLNGQLGLNDRTDRSSPVQIGSDATWTNLSSGSDVNSGQSSSIAIKTDRTLWTWGRNNNGQLGLNDTIDRSSPVQVGVLTTWNKVIGDSFIFSFLSIKTDGTLWSWGRNAYGVLGLNDETDRSSPTQVGTDTNWNNISLGTGCAAVTKTDGTLWTWGNNWQGQSGFENNANASSPTQVGSDNDWNLITNSSTTTMATKTNGTLWTWGNNYFGQLGLNDKEINRSSPTQVGSDTNWNSVSGSGDHHAAIKTDGTLWKWGRNFDGQLGLNNIIDKSSPTQVGTDTNWNNISLGYYNNAGIKTNGTLWTFGRNNNGQLGHNNTINKSSPVQVGSDTNWSKANIGFSTIAFKEV
jgi:alpha-tubulin suppressor-like RCC1 family protein